MQRCGDIQKWDFLGFNSETNQNKKEKYVNITVDPKDNNLVIDGSSFKGKVDKDLIIGTWWNQKLFKRKPKLVLYQVELLIRKLNLKEKRSKNR